MLSNPKSKSGETHFTHLVGVTTESQGREQETGQDKELGLIMQSPACQGLVISCLGSSFIFQLLTLPIVSLPLTWSRHPFIKTFHGPSSLPNWAKALVQLGSHPIFPVVSVAVFQNYSPPSSKCACFFAQFCAFTNSLLSSHSNLPHVGGHYNWDVISLSRPSHVVPPPKSLLRHPLEKTLLLPLSCGSKLELYHAKIKSYKLGNTCSARERGRV